MKITLCGSARFERHYKIWNELLSLCGNIVYTLSVYPSDKADVKNWYNEADKKMLDQVHKRKIDNSDGILVLNCYGYLGLSTLSEIEYANHEHKTIFFLERWRESQGLERLSPTGRRAAAGYFIPVTYSSPIDTTIYRQPWDTELLGSLTELRSRLVDQYTRFERRDDERAAKIAYEMDEDPV
jgi:hypothetical protein